MTKEQLAEEYLDSKYHPVSQQRDNARKAYLAGFEAAETKWISVSDELPPLLTDEPYDEGEEETTSIWVRGANDKYVHIACVQYNYRTKDWYMYGDYHTTKSEVTYWMYEPKRPSND